MPKCVFNEFKGNAFGDHPRGVSPKYPNLPHNPGEWGKGIKEDNFKISNVKVVF